LVNVKSNYLITNIYLLNTIMIEDIFHYTALMLYIYATYSYKDVVSTELIYSWWSLFTILMFCIALASIEDRAKTNKNKKPKNVRMFNVCGM